MIRFQSPPLPRAELTASESIVQPFEHLLDFKTFTSLRRMVARQHSKPLVNRADFMQQITLYLPEVAALIEESDFGIVHLEVGAVCIATKKAIAKRDFATVRQHLSLIADVFDRAESELYDAIRVSYLEALFLGETTTARMEARRMLSRPMENTLRHAELELDRRCSTSTK